jgi:protein-S-isoprenylcysteine O-methyltransferase Ste14
MSSRLPVLGPRGEGWVVGQVALIGIIIVAGRHDAGSGSGSWGPAAFVAGLVAIGLGGLLVAWSIWDLRASLSPFPRPVAGAALVETGAYGWIRHPIYTGMVLAGFGWSLATSSMLALIATGMLFLLLVGKAQREETWLIAAHPEYRAYQGRTKRFIPWVY